MKNSGQNDPFYLVRQEIQETVESLLSKFARWGGLSPSNPERLQLGKAIRQGCGNVLWQLDELQSAINKAAQNPAKFDLNEAELERRKSWLSTTRRQISNMENSVKAATERAQRGEPGSQGAVQKNDQFITDQRQQMEMITRQQDDQLEEINTAVGRLGQIGLTIHDELTTQADMLDELDEDVGVTQSRLKVAQRKIQEVIKKSGGKWYFCTIVTLIIVLLILIIIAVQ
ncbi:unnamed protein product [Ostreobium quekettii]|uniref:t-SNARE coiled-coil homology domain-containing protein n=1 Tax=Ostreobium quekettii TaxID=121088 RepID=A0A8S1ISN1_9CHLO|nr:unnamed protein product [Ostreobium quekettii]|eukprot:evm.model.scf_1258.4 EVM.evm.TU.scf_1258.4   scf_1258:21195-24444(-)